MRGRRRGTNRSSEEKTPPGNSEDVPIPRVTRRSLRKAEQDSAGNATTSGSAGATDSAKKQNQRKNYTESEAAEMWLFVINRIRDPVTQKIIKPKLKWKMVWAEYQAFAQTTRDCTSLDMFFKRSCKTLHSSTFDLQTKTNLYYALQLPVKNEEFLEELRAVVDLIVDGSNRIVAYRKKRKEGGMVSQDEDYWDEVWDEKEIAKSADGSQTPVSAADEMHESDNVEEEDDDEEGPSETTR